MNSSPRPKGKVGAGLRLSVTFATLNPHCCGNKRAKIVEEELKAIADEQQVNVDKLVDLVKENAIILAEMKRNLKQRVVQDILKIVMLSDVNNDGMSNQLPLDIAAAPNRTKYIRNILQG